MIMKKHTILGMIKEAKEKEERERKEKEAREREKNEPKEKEAAKEEPINQIGGNLEEINKLLSADDDFKKKKKKTENK